MNTASLIKQKSKSTILTRGAHSSGTGGYGFRNCRTGTELRGSFAVTVPVPKLPAVPIRRFFLWFFMVPNRRFFAVPAWFHGFPAVFRGSDLEPVVPARFRFENFLT